MIKTVGTFRQKIIFYLEILALNRVWNFSVIDYKHKSVIEKKKNFLVVFQFSDEESSYRMDWNM